VGLIPSQRGWDIIDLSVGLIIIYVGLKLNCGVYVGQLTWGFYFIVGEEGYEFLFYSGGLTNWINLDY